MKINIEDLRGKNRPVEFEFQEKGEEFLTELKIVIPLEVRCYLEFSEGALAVSCSIKGKIELNCTRCLEAFQHDVSGDFTIRYCDLRYAGNSKELKEDDLEEGLLPKDGILDISDIVRQQLLLKLPFRQICREDCLGMCQNCGTNLNLQKCACSNS